MGCEASETYQPHKKANKITLKVSEPKQLYNGFCFGSKAIQVYIPSKHPSQHFPPIDEQSNESFTVYPRSNILLDSSPRPSPWLL